MSNICLTCKQNIIKANKQVTFKTQFNKNLSNYLFLVNENTVLIRNYHRPDNFLMEEIFNIFVSIL